MTKSRSSTFHTSGSSPTCKSVSTPACDFLVENHGIFLVRPLTSAAISWVEERIGRENGYQPYYPTIVVEHRYIANIVAGIQNNGLAVQ